MFYSAEHGTRALDGPEGQNSPFVDALATRLEQPGLPIDRLFRLVRDDVLQKTNGQQKPFTYDSLPAEDLFFKVAEAR